jgi:hypothetical protein
LQRLLTTWLQAQKHTGVHSLDANLKTHVQGKQVYVGCISPSASFGVTRSFLLPPSKAPELRASQLVAYFRCPFSLAYAVTSYGCCSCCSYNTKVEKWIRSSSNSRTKETQEIQS